MFTERHVRGYPYTTLFTVAPNQVLLTSPLTKKWVHDGIHAKVQQYTAMRWNNLQHTTTQMNCTSYNVEQKKPQSRAHSNHAWFNLQKVQNRQNSSAVLQVKRVLVVTRKGREGTLEVVVNFLIWEPVTWVSSIHENVSTELNTWV